MSVSWSLTYAENFFLDNIFALIYLYFFIRFSHDQWKRHPLVSESLERGSGWILKGTLGSVIHSLGIIRDRSQMNSRPPNRNQMRKGSFNFQEDKNSR